MKSLSYRYLSAGVALRNIMWLAAAVSILPLSCNAAMLPEEDQTGTVKVSTAGELASKAVAVTDSHAGEEQWSALQPMTGTYIVLPHKWLLKDDVVENGYANYPRVKKMASGEYIMFWHGNRYGSRIWCSISSDLRNWSEPVMLFRPEFPVLEDGQKDVRRYVNMDAAVLPDGDILAVCSYRAEKHYSQNMGSGLCTVRSSDNGRTWSEPHHIYEGCNWEPYLLRLPDGRIQCYFTDGTPQCRNSGTSVMVSSDNGFSWGGKIRVCRQFKYFYDGPNTGYTGTKIYTDQMPSFRVLNDGKTIFGFLEARLEHPASNQGRSYCMMSAVWSDGLDWKDLGEESEGPARRATNALRGAGGYVSAFPSGEVVISCTYEQLLKLKVLDHDGQCPSETTWSEDWLFPFPGKGFWAGTEVDSPCTMVAAMHCDEGIQVERLWLNHRIDAEPAAAVLDGDGSEWTGTQALFLTSSDGDETLIRARHDEKNLYLLVETAFAGAQEDSAVSSRTGDHRLNLRIANSGDRKYGILSIDAQGGVEAKRLSQSHASAQGVTSDGRTGIVTEIAVPLSELGAAVPGDYLCIYAEAATPSGTTAFSMSDPSLRSTWQRILLK